MNLFDESAGGSAQARVPPQDLLAEQATLGSMLLEAQAAELVLAFLSDEDFYREAHRIIYRAMQAVHQRREPVDLITVSAELRREGVQDEVGGPEYLIALIGEVPTTAHVLRYAGIVHEKWRLRRLIALGMETAREAYEQPEDVQAFASQVEQAALDIATNGAGKPKSIGEYDVQGSVETFLLQREGFDHERPHFDIDGIDHKTSGMPWPGYVILMGDSGMGKTCLAMQSAHHETRAHRRRVLYYTLEMDVEAQIIPRLAMMHVGTRSASYEELTAAAVQVLCLPLEFRDRAVTVEEVCAEVKRASRSANPPRLVVIDYVQLLGTTRRLEETAKYRHISRELKLLSNEARVTVLAVSQVTYKQGTRDSESFGSRGFGQDADMEIEVDKDGSTQHERRKNMEATIMVRKNRQPSGWVGDVKVEAYAWRLWEREAVPQQPKRERRDGRND